MNQLLNEKLKIENMIYEVRGKQVMLDSDLAKLYECANGTKSINQAVTRHRDRFPEDFYFQLTKEEHNNILKSQFGTLELKQGQYTKYLPYVFTEQGVAMLSAVLRTNVASVTSIKIMRAFVQMRKYISNSLLSNDLISYKVLEHDKRISALEKTFNGFKEQNSHLFFEGQIYDAYSLLLDIFNASKNEIIIIDNYADKELLDIVSKTNKNVTIISKNMDDILIKKYQKQYNNISLINNDSFHDRFIIIDKERLYTCGSSFKDLGKKCFAITLIENKKILMDVLQELNL